MKEPSSEAELTTIVLSQLKKLPGVKAWRCNTGKRAGVTFGDKGAPDIMCIVGPFGRFIGIELKFEKNKTSEVQDSWIESANSLGALCYIARDLEEALSPVLRELHSSLSQNNYIAIRNKKK